jgi:hypothetical protein
VVSHDNDGPYLRAGPLELEVLGLDFPQPLRQLVPGLELSLQALKVRRLGLQLRPRLTKPSLGLSRRLLMRCLCRLQFLPGCIWARRNRGL